MRKYTKEEFLKAAEIGEVSMIDAKHIVSRLDKAKITDRKEYQKQYQNALCFQLRCYYHITLSTIWDGKDQPFWVT